MLLQLYVSDQVGIIDIIWRDYKNRPSSDIPKKKNRKDLLGFLNCNDCQGKPHSNVKDVLLS